MTAAVMFAWLAISCACAALAATAPLRWAAPIVIFCLPMSGTAAWMLGGDPLLLPLVVSLGFLARHAFALLGRRELNQFLDLARTDVALLLLAAYCAISGLLFPKLFEGQTIVMSQNVMHGGVRLNPGQISYVQIAYVVLGVWIYLALRQAIRRTGLEWIVIAILAQTAIFSSIGLVQAVMGMAGLRMPTNWIVNNTGYALMTQVMLGGFTRVTSVFVESSAFAGWAAGAFAFTYALYLNRIKPRTNLVLMALVGLAMLLSTSSTSYFGLLVIGMFAALHVLLDNDARRRSRGLVVLGAGLFAVTAAGLVLAAASGGFLGQLRDMMAEVTIEKGGSGSGVERLALGQHSVQNALDTALLGTGYGTSRSSGLLFMLAGSTGIPGLLLFFLAMIPLCWRAFRRPRTGEDAVVTAGAFALACTIGAMIASASDVALPNMMWAYAAIAAAPVAARQAERRAREFAAQQSGPPPEPAGEAG